MHHARLKNVFEKLIVIDSSTSLHFKDPTDTRRVCISVEALQYLAFSAEKHWYNNLIVRGLTLLNPEAYLF